MLDNLPVAWTSRLALMGRSDRVYKPAMLLVAIDLIDENRATPSWIPLADLLARFDDLLARAGLLARPRGPRRGYKPAYHLSSSGSPASPVPFWVLRQDTHLITGLGVPTSNASLLRAADAAALLPEVAEQADDPDGRRLMRWAIYELLERDGAEDSMALVRTHDVDYVRVGAEQARLDERLQRPFILNDDHASRTLSIFERRARQRAFRASVLDAYERACALCSTRIHWRGLIEAEAAHIKPHALSGADDLRNGLALCRTHHWSFDRGLWTADDAYIVDVQASSDGAADDLAALRVFRGGRLRPPVNPDAAPHSVALAWHREGPFREARQ